MELQNGVGLFICFFVSGIASIKLKVGSLSG